ncbi:aldehyde dehydrogenase family protein [Paraburkholderia sp. 31.1]|nr:aldehyde dehydrogenase family protein [Paraburkholderia sp. 31.1]
MYRGQKSGDSVPAATEADEADEAAALAAAERGFALWSKTPAWERAAVLRRAADLLRARNETYAFLMSGETGKPLLEARGEVNASAPKQRSGCDSRLWRIAWAPVFRGV